MGQNYVGEVTFESCAYVARYICKKITGQQAESHYEKIDLQTGEIYQLQPEYATMSRRPGIGKQHFDQYYESIYKRDEVAMRGHLNKPPKFYDKQLEKISPQLYQHIKDQRECALTLAPKHDRTPLRLEQREIVKLAQLGTYLQRKYEHET